MGESSTSPEQQQQPAAAEHEQEADSKYCFKWGNYQQYLSEVVRQLLDEECMVDVTLHAGGEKIQAHRLVLCACSTLFQVCFVFVCVTLECFVLCGLFVCVLGGWG